MWVLWVYCALALLTAAVVYEGYRSEGSGVGLSAVMGVVLGTLWLPLLALMLLAILHDASR